MSFPKDGVACNVSLGGNGVLTALNGAVNNQLITVGGAAGMPVGHNCELVALSCAAIHGDLADPGAWTITWRKFTAATNTLVDSVTMTVPMTLLGLTNHNTARKVVTPIAMTSGTHIWDLNATGPTVSTWIRMQVDVIFQLNP